VKTGAFVFRSLEIIAMKAKQSFSIFPDDDIIAKWGTVVISLYFIMF